MYMQLKPHILIRSRLCNYSYLAESGTSSY